MGGGNLVAALWRPFCRSCGRVFGRGRDTAPCSGRRMFDTSSRAGVSAGLRSSVTAFVLRRKEWKRSSLSWHSSRIRFVYDNGTLEYIGGERTVIEDVDMDCWSLFEAYAEVGQFGYTKEKISAFWYKDLSSEWLKNDLKLFEGDRDAIEMCKIAGKRGHVDLYVVHKVEVDEEFPEVGFFNVGGPGEHVQEVERANDEEVHNQNQLVIYQGDGGQEVERANAETVKNGDKLNPDDVDKWNSDEDSDDENFIPSDGEVDSADDVIFTDSEEEYDDKSGFDEVRGGTDGDRVEKGKGVAGGDFSDEVYVDYEVGGGSEKEDNEDDDENEAIRYPIHKNVKDMTRYKWEVGTVFASREEFKDTVTAYAVQTRRGLRYAKLDLVRVRALCQEGCPFWLYAAKMSEEETWQLRSMNLKHTCGQSHSVGILHTGWLSKVFRKKVEGNPKVKIKDLVNKARRKWNLTVTTSMAARSRQATLDEIQGAYRKQYKRIADYCSELLRANPGSSVTLKKTNFDDVMPPPYRKPSHRPVKKRKRGPDEPPDSSQSHLSRRGQIQRCSNCGESGHKRGGCKKPSLDAQQPRQAASKKTRGGRKPLSIRPKTSSKALFQPEKPNRKSTRSLTQQPPAPKEKGATSFSQPARPVSFSHRIPLHVSPRKLRLMAKLPPRLWRKL
ncbi:hypothetical protein Ahy_A05g025506 [Arachis hypogaea]|uniref:CCHC-type domain-containing protein n=1 Tax=Arachis hypogaea TaxID=3818 RepID=A0A445D8W4_ARAHY|nr:hypothetical protein Ahy_A05g025506 [Arachis hypogaea]